MVAVIHSSSSLRNALNYNEQKVKQQVATCLAAVNYPKDVEDLNFYQKLSRLHNQAELNVRTKINSVHISLNFDPSERLTEERLKEISEAYMQKIGFENQPYLLYQHHDSGHPHVHILTTNIRNNGRRIELHNLGKNQSEKARKEIENAFGLIRADERKQRQMLDIKPVNIQKIKYGSSETKRAITNVLDTVLKNYKYTSLPELNAVLVQYNVAADRGSENSRIFQNSGLTYRILDERGNKVGVPIKASSFYNKPTLKFLEEQFKLNEAVRQSHKQKVKNVIDLSFLKHPQQTLENLIKVLEKDGINSVLRQNANGIIYGITYVDHQTKCVFNGSILGKQYSAKGILERCSEIKETSGQKVDFIKPPSSKTLPQTEQRPTYAPLQNKDDNDLLENLLKPEYTSGFVPNQLTQKGKKKKKKRILKQ